MTDAGKAHYRDASRGSVRRSRPRAARFVAGLAVGLVLALLGGACGSAGDRIIASVGPADVLTEPAGLNGETPGDPASFAGPSTSGATTVTVAVAVAGVVAATTTTTSTTPEPAASTTLGDDPDGADPDAVDAAAAADDAGTTEATAVSPTAVTASAASTGPANAGAAGTSSPTNSAGPLVPATTAPPVTSAAARAFGPCSVEPLARSAGLDSFYTKVCWAGGVPVVSSAEVDDLALQAAAEILVQMLRNRPDLLAELANRKLRVGVIGTNQRAVELPEYRDLPTSYPNTDWDAARAYGATPRRPLLAAPEENLTCSAVDSYPGQSVLTHEIGHTVLDMAVATHDRNFKGRIEAAYRQALGNPTYGQTYAMTNADEYWAEGVQDFFNASRAAYGPNGGGDGYDGPIASRAGLRQYDPVLYGLIAEVFTEVDWRPSCP